MCRTDAKLTGIEPREPRSRARVLALDGEPWRTTSADVVAALGLERDATVCPEDLLERIDAEEPAQCRSRALRILDARDRARGELAERLRADGYPADVVDAVVERFAEVGLVDDERYGAAIVRSLFEGKGYGRHRIRQDLRRRRIPDDLAERLIEAVDPDSEAERALDAARRALRTCDDTQKLVQRLVRRGFDWETSRKAVTLAREADGDSPA